MVGVVSLACQSEARRASLTLPAQCGSRWYLCVEKSGPVTQVFLQGPGRLFPHGGPSTVVMSARKAQPVLAIYILHEQLHCRRVKEPVRNAQLGESCQIFAYDVKLEG